MIALILLIPLAFSFDGELGASWPKLNAFKRAMFTQDQAYDERLATHPTGKMLQQDVSHL